MSLKSNPKEINIILNILKGAQFEFLPRAPFYIGTPLHTFDVLTSEFTDIYGTVFVSKLTDIQQIEEHVTDMSSGTVMLIFDVSLGPSAYDSCYLDLVAMRYHESTTLHQLSLLQFGNIS
jgi:hypothetical protein